MADQNATAPNAQQIEEWNGKTGGKWVRYQDRLDRMLAPFGDAVLKAASIKSGERVLDVGCGCGATTLEAAASAGKSGRTLGIDISGPMVARAKERAAALGLSADFLVADAATHAFQPASFDLLLSRFGVMFFDEPAAAFANIHKGMAKTGRLAFACWRSTKENPWLTTPMRAVLPLLPPQEPAVPDAPGPFAFADKDRVASILATAGFRDIVLTPFDAAAVLGVPESRDPVEDALGQALEIGPLARLLASQPDDLRERAKAAVRTELAKHLTADGVKLPGAIWLVTAHA
ncbi:MAG TPA: methyltransferase domain-containing protein [Parvibaculum sp.]